MSEYLDIIEERGDFRVRLAYDDSADKPYDDGATPIFTVERSGYGRSVEAFNSQAEKYVGAVAEILDRHDMETLARFVKIFYGATKLDTFYSEGIRGHYVAFDTAEWREEVGAPVEYLKDEYFLSEVRAWAEGEVFGYIVEKRVSYTKAYEDGRDDVEDAEWEDVDSCWGFYGREWAEQAAIEALNDAIEWAAKK